MAVVCPKIHGTKFSDVNGYYRVEDFNLGFGENTAQWRQATYAYANVTFANAGNVLGCVMGLSQAAYSAVVDKRVRASLEIIQSVTSFDATNDKVQKVAHGYANGDRVSFSTTGTIPGGITVGLQYFVINKTDDDFEISLTSGGTKINITTVGTGTVTMGVEVAGHLCTLDELYGTTREQYRQLFHSMAVPIDFDVFYGGAGSLAVTTDANKYRLLFATANTNDETGTVGAYYFLQSGTTASRSADSTFFAIWCNNQLSLSDNDTLVVTKHTIIDASKTLQIAALANDQTKVGMCMLICGMPKDYDFGLEWENPETASYTLTLQGLVGVGQYSGFRIGTPTNLVQVATPANIVWDNANLGSVTTTSFYGIGYYANDSYGAMTWSCAMYGTVIPYTRLAQDALINATSIITANDMSASWSAGDTIYISKISPVNNFDETAYTIDSIVGTTVNLTTPLLKKRLTGGFVVKHNDYSINVTRANTVSSWLSRMQYCFLWLQGVKFTRVSIIPYQSPSGVLIPNIARCNQLTVTDCLFWKEPSDTGTTLFQFLYSGIYGALVQRCMSYYQQFFYNNYSYIASALYQYKQLPIYVRDCGKFYVNSSDFTSYLGNVYDTYDVIGFYCHDNQNTVAYYNGSVTFSGVNSRFKTIEIHLHSTGSGGYAALRLENLINPVELDDITIDQAYWAIGTSTTAGIGIRITNLKVGQYGLVNNLINLATTNQEITLVSPIITVYNPIDATLIPYMGNNFKLVITDYNGTVNDHRMYKANYDTQSTGDGLTDTTVHTSGTGKFALRLAPKSSAFLAEWEQKIPTGNIQNKDMQISVWIKINNANYYGGTTYQLPRLNINYDNGTTTYCQASETTDWQKLYVNFTPTTTYGEITMTVDGYTDATGSNAYFYIDDVSVLYPTGVSLDLSGLDLWADGLPVSPAITQVVADAGTLWDALQENHTVTGSFGEQVGKKLLTTGKFIALK